MSSLRGFEVFIRGGYERPDDTAITPLIEALMGVHASDPNERYPNVIVGEPPWGP